QEVATARPDATQTWKTAIANRARSSYAHSNASSTSLTLVVGPGGVGVKTCIARTEASGATPRSPPKVRPAAIDATCVPWSQPAPSHGTAAPAPSCVGSPLGQAPTPGAVASVKHASSTTLPLSIGWPPSTPVSTTTIVCAAP